MSWRLNVVFPDLEILHTHVQNLTWSHFRLIMRVSDPVAREWYINEASNMNTCMPQNTV